jgi:hypothetical protein
MFKQISSKAAGYRLPGAGKTDRSNKLFGKAAGEKTPQAYPQGYVEDVLEARTQPRACFNGLR